MTITTLILFSKNWAGKAQAGRFSPEEADRVTLAAAKHGTTILACTGNDDPDLLAALPAGRLGENDRPLLTAIRQDIYKRLAILAAPKLDGEPQEAPQTVHEGAKTATKRRAAAMAAPADAKASEPASINIIMKEGKAQWPGVKPGDTVLAPDFGEDGYNGWWEAIVKARSETHVTLTWQDYPDLPPFTRSITQITLRHPECKLA